MESNKTCRVPPVDEKCSLQECIDFIMKCAKTARALNQYKLRYHDVRKYPFDEGIEEHLKDSSDVVESFLYQVVDNSIESGAGIPAFSTKGRVKHIWKIHIGYWRFEHCFVQIKLGSRWWYVDVCADLLEPVIRQFGNGLIDQGVYISLCTPEYLDVIDFEKPGLLSKVKFAKNLRKECTAAGADLDGDTISYACKQTDVFNNRTTITLADYLEYVVKADRAYKKWTEHQSKTKD